MEIMKDKLSAESAKSEAEYARKEADNLSAIHEMLRRQIEEDVPREARRLYIEHRLDVLGRAISEQYKEYHALQNEAAGFKNAELDERLAFVVKETILPNHIIRARRERWTLALLIGVVLLTISPFELQRIASFFTSQPFYILSYSYEYELSAVNLSVAGVILVWASIFTLLAKFPTNLQITIRGLRAPRWLQFSILLVGLLLIMIGNVFSDVAGRAFEAGNYTMSEEPYQLAAACLHLASFVIGALVAFVYWPKGRRLVSRLRQVSLKGQSRIK
ncbi:hypothetical protein HerbRD11066_29450 [Herbidospora sp. RD11066]